MALSADRKTDFRTGDYVAHPVKAGAVLYAGALVALDATGYAVPGAVATDITAVGRSESRYDNSAGIDGDVVAEIRTGIFHYANDGGDPVDRTHIGTACYILDDETVSSSDGTLTRSVAGRVVDVDTSGVWVHVGPIA